MAQIYALPRARYSTLVAANVRAEAARRGFNQVSLAAVLGISQPNVSKRWRGVHPFSLDELALLADAFDVDDEVLTRCPRPDSNRQPAGWLAEVVRGPWAPRLVAGVAAVSA